jgi:hypothetical protein
MLLLYTILSLYVLSLCNTAIRCALQAPEKHHSFTLECPKKLRRTKHCLAQCYCVADPPGGILCKWNGEEDNAGIRNYEDKLNIACRERCVCHDVEKTITDRLVGPNDSLQGGLPVRRSILGGWPPALSGTDNRACRRGREVTRRLLI